MGSNNHQQEHQHHILPAKTAILIGGTLLFLTAVTVWVAHIDLGRLNFFIAMLVATVKALFVALFFMNLKYDKSEDGMIFATAFVFLGIFMVLTATDIFFRGDVYVKGPLTAETKSQISKPWVSTPQLVARGKELFTAQCVACHGAEGKGDGPAATALNPHPRNFTSPDGWKNGRKATMVFKTLKEGLPPSGMASFATLPSDDRWALTHFVLSLLPAPLADTPADFAKIGVDPTKESAVEKVEATIPVELAMAQMTVPDEPAHLYHPDFEGKNTARTAGGRLYEAHCLECHGLKGEGGIKVRNLGVNPVAFVTTQPLKNKVDAMRSEESFSTIVKRGIPGNIMPGVGHLNSSEMKELYQFVKELK